MGQEWTWSFLNMKTDVLGEGLKGGLCSVVGGCHAGSGPISPAHSISSKLSENEDFCLGSLHPLTPSTGGSAERLWFRFLSCLPTASGQ